MVVTDNETTTLTLAAPATLAENAGPTAATLTLGAPVLSPLVVNLSSSVASAATVPTTVTVPAGATSVSFLITPINDVMLDGPQTTVLTATVAGWIPATHTLEVTDNETRSLSFVLASAITEGNTGTVSITLGGTLTTDLVVTLVSSDPTQLVAPATVTIPAGLVGATLTLSAPDDTTTNGTRTVDLSASAATFTSATQAITIIDNDPHHFDFDSIPSPQANQIPFSARITARTIDGTLLTGYTGIATLSAAGTSGPISITPTGTAAFSAGAWTGQVTLAQAGAAVRITATDGIITGVSNAFDVTLSPALTVTPDRLDVTLTIDTSTTRTLTLANTGGGQLTWTLGITASSASEILPGPRFDGPAAVENAPKVEPQSLSSAPIHEAVRDPSPAPAPAFATIPLETILANLNRDNAPVLAAIPSRYAFTEGVTGTSIGDGGGDMYDTGNLLSTSLSAAALAYSDNAIASAPASLGSGGRYFTRKLNGLFVFAADIAGLSYFDITGNLGADGSGSTDTAILTQTRNGVTYKGFVKRVFNAGDPSVNHLVIVADNGSATHAASTSTDSDYHRTSNLSGVTRIYYLLYAGTSGAYINDTSTQALFSAFLDAAGTPDFVTVSPTSGTIAGGTTRDLTVSLDATGVAPGLYERTLRLTSNDPARPLVTVPVALTVQDRVLHHFEFDAMPSSLVRGVPATVRLHARDAAGLPVVTFNSPVTLSATGTTLAAPVTATGWIGGTWTGLVTPATFASVATLTADNGTGITSASAPFAVAAGPLAQLLWDPIASPQAVDTDFPVTVRAADAGGNALTDFSGPISLSALLPRVIADTGSAYTTDSYPFAASAGAVVREQVLYPAASLGGVPRRLASLALNLTSLSGATSLNNWTIRLKTTTRTSLTSSPFDSDGWTTVHVSTATLATAGWQTFIFSTPFDYDGTSSLLVDFSFRNPAPVSTTVNTSVSYSSSGTRALKKTSASASDDPFAFTSASTFSTLVPIIRFGDLQSVPLRLPNADMINGVWSGPVSLAASGDPVQLRAASVTPSVSGISNTFAVSAPPSPAPALPLAETWESGAFASAWTITGTNTHRSQITSSYTPHGGTRHLTLDSSSYGTYSRNEATLTLDLAGRTGVILNFWAKGFNETAHAPATNPFTGGADFDGVAISTDGITWHEVQPLRSPALTNVWQQFTVDLDTALATRGLAYTSAFRIRFNRYGYEYLTIGGIALDDISVTTAPVVSPTLTLPATAVESAAPLAGALSLPASRPADTVFTLTSSASAKLALPATITLPAGQTTVAFTASPIDDTLIDGSRTVIIKATPPAGSGLFPGTTTIVLTDDEAPSLTLSVSPASVTENTSSATATLTLGTPPASSLTVALASSDPTAATVPATLTLAPGQTAATFLVTPVNDTKIDGTQTTTLSATLPNAPPATALFTVTDNETTTLGLSSTTVTEGSTATASVSITGTLPAPLTITLTSANPAQLTVPATVTIPAGSTSATFTLTPVDDTDTDGSVSVAITATATGFTSASATSTVRDNDVHHFSITASVSSPQLANRTFTTTAYARTIDDYTATFNGTVNLSANAGTTVLPATPTSITFSRGYWSGPVSVNAPATGVTLRLDDGAGHTGVSSTFNVTVGALDHFAFAPIASPQSATMPVPLTLTAQDAANNTVTSFAGTAALTAALPSRFIGTGTTNYGLPFGSYQSRTQSIYLASELGAAGRLSGLALDVISAPGSAVPNFTIRVKSTTLSAYATAAWESTGWTTVYQGSPTISAAGWFQFNFTTPFDYDGATNLMVDVSYNSSTYISSGSSKGTTTTATRTLWINTSGQADPLTWSGTTPTPGTSTGVLNLRLNIQHPAVLTPAVSGAFVNGVWSGNATFATTATDVAIQATSGSALGFSNTFTVQTGGIPNLNVTTGNFTSTGYRSGPFTPATRSWTLTNSSSSPLSWSTVKAASWLSLNPASGTLDGGASITVTASFAPETLAFDLGTYTDSIIFFNQTNGLGSTVRDVSLTILPAGDLAVTPAAAFDSTGDQGGPFTPATTTWTISNPGDATLSWTAAKTASWLSLDTTGGTLAPGATGAVTATITSAANDLNPGSYTDTVTFTNTTTGRGNTGRTVNLIVRLGPPRIITQPPATLTSPFRRSVALKVTTSPGDTVTYQWYRGPSGTTTTPVPGATGSTLITPPLSSDTSFWVRITNAQGSTDSIATAVTVQPALSLNLLSTGYNLSGQLGDGTLNARNIPLQVSHGVAQAFIRESHSVFVKSDGTLWAMGANDSGQLGDGTTTVRPLPVQIATNAVQVSAGTSFTVFLKTDGTLWGMGANSSNQLGSAAGSSPATPVQIASGVVQVAAGSSHTLFVKTDGTLWAVGYNGSGQLGDGTTTSRSTPVQIATGVAQVSAGANHSLFLKTNGTLWAMGYNYAGQLGDGTTTQRPTPVQAATDVASISAGSYFSLFIKTDGTLWGVGSNTGQLGDGTNYDRTTQVLISTGVDQAAGGYAHTLFVKTNGTLWATGTNYYGSFGDGTNTSRLSPVQVNSAVSEASAGNSSSLFLSQKPGFVTQPASASILPSQTATLSVIASGPDTITYQWYQGITGNTSSPIAGANASVYTTPSLTIGSSYWVRVSSSFGSTNSVTAVVTINTPPTFITQPSATTVAWGRNAVLSVSASGGALAYQWYRGISGDTSAPVSGAVGPTFLTPSLQASTPYWVRITNLAGTVDSPTANVAVFSAAYNLKGMGSNTSGQLGNSTTTNASTPQSITTGVAQIANGGSFSLILKTDGTLWATGSNSSGQFGNGTLVNSTTPIQVASSVMQIAAGNAHGLFVKTNGTLWAMGNNSSGQLGDSTTTQRSTPVQIASNVVQVDAGSSHTLFLKSDGTLWSCGYNNRGQLANGTNSDRSTPSQIASGVAYIAAGSNQSFFIKSDSTLWAAGENFGGQLADSTILHRNLPIQVATDVAQVSTDYYITLFIKTNRTLWAVGANWHGQLGDGTTTDRYSPVQVATNVSQVDAGDRFSLFVKTDGTLWAAGLNASGQLGNGTNTNQSTPVQIASGVAQVSNGANHSHFLQSPPPVISSHPYSHQVLQGQSTTLAVSSSSPISLTYQWYAGLSGNTTLPVSGAVTSSFITPPVVAPANYWVRVSNVVGSTDSQTAALTLLPPPDTDADGLPDAWETAHGLDPASSTAANGRLGDPDHDGLPNLLEYAMGLDPTHAETTSPTSGQIATNPETGLSHLVFTYRRLIYPGALTYTVTTSSNLTDWSAPATVPDMLSTVANPDGLTETVTLRINPALGTGRVFVRLQVDAP